MRQGLLSLQTSIFSTDTNVAFKVYDPVPAHCGNCKKTFASAPKDWFCDTCSTILWDHISDHPNCALCSAEFTLFYRHHHCRRCGRTVCDRCSPSFALFPCWGQESAQHARRVCTECTSTLMETQLSNNNNNAKTGGAISSTNNNNNTSSAMNNNQNTATRRFEAKNQPTNNSNQDRSSSVTSQQRSNNNGNKQSSGGGGGQRQASFNLHFILIEAMKNYSIDSLSKELLQNSDDAGCKGVTFVIDHQRRTLWHFQDGQLSDKDFNALGNFYGHTKMTDFTKIGRFGVGFASIFHCCDVPKATSAGRYWSMDLETLNVEDTAVDDPNDNDSSSSGSDEDEEEEEQEEEKKKENHTENDDDNDNEKKKEEDKPNNKNKKKKKKKEPRQKFYGLQLPENIEKAIPDVEKGAIFNYAFRDVPLELSSVITFPVTSMERCEQVFADNLFHHSILFFLNSVRRLRLYSLRRDGTMKELINNTIMPCEELNRIKAQAKSSLQQLRVLPYLETKAVQLRTMKKNINSNSKSQANNNNNNNANKATTTVAAVANNDPSNLETHTWWYCCEIVLPQKLNATTSTNEEKLANAPVTIQLAAPVGDCHREANNNSIFAVGLPLTGIKSPLLCNASATLDLDATRINIRTVQSSKRNHLAVQYLIKNYCHRFLPMLDSYMNENWPVHVDDITDAFMNVLFKNIIRETMKISPPGTRNLALGSNNSSTSSSSASSSGWSSFFGGTSSSSSNNQRQQQQDNNLFSGPLFGVLFGGKEHLGYFPSLCFLADSSKSEMVYGVYQRIAMATYPEFKIDNSSNESSSTTTKPSSNNPKNTNTPRLPLISILNDKYQQHYKTANENSLVICTPDYLLRQLQQVDVATLDRAGISDEERLLLLRFFLQSSNSSSKSAQSLRGLPLRQTTRGWSRFDPNVVTFFGDEKAQVTKILLPSPESDAIASEAMSRIFRVIAIPDAVAELDMSHLLANNSKLLLEQIQFVVQNQKTKTDASKNIVHYLSEFWKFINASLSKHRQSTVNTTLQQYLNDLPLVATSEELGDGNNVRKVSTLNSMICATSGSITTTSGVSADFLRIITQVLKIPLVHQDLLPAIFVHPQATFSKLENFKHIIGLLKYKLVDLVAVEQQHRQQQQQFQVNNNNNINNDLAVTATTLYKFTEKDFSCIRQYILDNRFSLEQYAREVGPLVKTLPIFRQLGGGDSSNNNAGSDNNISNNNNNNNIHTNLLHKNARFIPEELFVQLPSFAREAVLIAVSPVIARSLHLALDKLDDVIRNALVGDRWLSLSPSEQLSIFQWIVQQNKTEMLTDVRVPTMQKSRSSKICDLYYFNPEKSSKSSSGNAVDGSSSSTNTSNGLDELLLQVCRKYCPELFADPSSSLKDIVEEAVKSKNIKTSLDAPLLKEMMKRVISTFRPFQIEIKLGDSHMKVWKLFPPEYQDLVIVLKELFYFPHHLATLDHANLPYCVAVKRLQQQQQPSPITHQQQQQNQQSSNRGWTSFLGGTTQQQQPQRQQQALPPIDRTKELFQVIITKSEYAVSEQFFDIIGGYETAVALPPPPPHDKHDGVRYGKRPVQEAYPALAQRWRELLSLSSVWPSCTEDCKCRRPQFLNALASSDKGRHVVFLCYIIENELLRILRQNQGSHSAMKQLAQTIQKVLPRNLPFLMIPGRPASMLFEAPEDCCSAETFDPLVPVVKEKIWRDLYSIPPEPLITIPFCKKILLDKWLNEHLPSKGLSALTRLVMILLRNIPAVNPNSTTSRMRHQNNSNSNNMYDLSTWMVLPNRQSTMCRASSLVYIYGSEDSEIMKLLSQDEDISSRLIHPQFSHRRLGNRLDQLGVRNFRDALQLPIKDFLEDAQMQKRKQVYQSRIASDAFAKVLELLLLDCEDGLELLEDGFENPVSSSSSSSLATGANYHDPNTNLTPEAIKEQKMDEIRRTISKLKRVQILLVNKLRVSWGQQQNNNNNNNSNNNVVVKTIDSLPYAIEKVYSTIHARNNASSTPTRVVSGAKFFLLTWRMDNVTESALNCDEEELRSSLVDCILEYLGIDDKIGKKLTYWLKRDEKDLAMYLNRRKQEEEKLSTEDNVVQLSEQEIQAALKSGGSGDNNMSSPTVDTKNMTEEEKRKYEQEKLKQQFAEQERSRIKKEEDERKQKEELMIAAKNTNEEDKRSIVSADTGSQQKGEEMLSDPPVRPDSKSAAAAPKTDNKSAALEGQVISSGVNDDDDDDLEVIPTGQVVPQQGQQGSSESHQKKDSNSNNQSGLGGLFSKVVSNFFGGKDNNNQQQPELPKPTTTTTPPPSSSSSPASAPPAQQQHGTTNIDEGNSQGHQHQQHSSSSPPPPSTNNNNNDGGLVKNGTNFASFDHNKKFNLDDKFSHPKNDFMYNDNNNSNSNKSFLPSTIPGTHSDNSTSELPQKQVSDTPCAVVDDLVLMPGQNPPKRNCCKIYVTRGATIPEVYQGTNVMAAIESFSIVLKEISVIVDPDSFQHCALYWSTAPSNTLAFNSNGAMFFNLSFYIRSPDQEQWWGTFLHEYAHNSSHDHGQIFVKALQSLSGRVIKRLMGHTPDPD